MKIGIDMLAIQSPWSGESGLGRYARALVKEMIAQGHEHHFFLYSHEASGLPDAPIPSASNATTVAIRPRPGLGIASATQRFEEEIQSNPHDLDWLLLLNPFDPVLGYQAPGKPLNDLKMAALVQAHTTLTTSVSPFPGPTNAIRHERALLNLRRYDLFLVDSEETAVECRTLIRGDDRHVLTIGVGGDGRFFVPDRSQPLSSRVKTWFGSIGIRGPFFLVLEPEGDQSAFRLVLDAFRRLPVPVRRAHQLLVLSPRASGRQGPIRAVAEDLGIEDRLIFACGLDDETVRSLYQRCTGLVDTSSGRQTDQALIEAMLSGAAVVTTGRAPARAELMGDAALFSVMAHDSRALVDRLAALVEEPDLAARLRARAPSQASRFDWGRVARRALEAFDRVAAPDPGRNGRRTRRRPLPKPRIALFSTFPPFPSGVSDYAIRLARELRSEYVVDLFHDPSEVPPLGLDPSEFACHDYRLFERKRKTLAYRGLVYQMANLSHYRFVFETLMRHPGVVTLHDIEMASFYEYAYTPRAEALRRFLRWDDPEQAVRLDPLLDEWAGRPGRAHEECLRRGISMSRPVLERSRAVVVHSRWCLGRLRSLYPEHAERTVLVPMGAAPRGAIAPARREAIRRRLGLPRDALLITSPGIMSSAKMNVETVAAFAPLARDHPSALLVFAGLDGGAGQVRAEVEIHGLKDRVSILGRLSEADYLDLIAATDIGVSLRRPPTQGENSAALLDLLRSGVPTIVIDTGSFAEYPDDVVLKVDWKREGLEGLTCAPRRIAEDPSLRVSLGESARSHVLADHDWRRSARLYRELIERCDSQSSIPRLSTESVPGMGLLPATPTPSLMPRSLTHDPTPALVADLRAAVSGYFRYERLLDLFPAFVSENTPLGATVLVVSKGDDRLLRLPGRRAWHFMRDPRSGGYAGHHPAAGGSAVEHLESLRRSGAGYLVIPETSHWWLDHYTDFRVHLERSCRVVGSRPGIGVILALCRPERVDAARETTVVARSTDYPRLIGQIKALALESVPEGATVLVIAKGDDRLLSLPGRRAWHFMRDPRSGGYAGHHPAAGGSAVEHLEELRMLGADYLVVPETSHWWLDHYTDFRAHLERHARVVGHRRGVGIVFALGGGPGPERRKSRGKDLGRTADR